MKKYSMFCADANRAIRINKEKDHEYRDRFQRDRDRIMYSKEFRRLSGKTQVFNAGFDDNIRTRLTHTLEVAQIARTICDALGLNSTLAEAIAYGHDVGHTPFGHVGERTLNYIMNSCVDYYGYNKNCTPDEFGFKHNLQSLKVLTELEKTSDEYKGLNLTKETLWGVVNHSSLKYKQCLYYSEKGYCCFKNKNKSCKKSGEQPLNYYDKYLKLIDDEKDWSIEGIIVALADEIAQRHHDIEDGLYAGIIDRGKLKEILSPIYDNNYYTINDYEDNIDLYISSVSKALNYYYCTKCIEIISVKLEEFKEKYGISNSNDFYKKKGII